VAHRATAEILARHADPRRPVPTMTFDQEMTLEAGPHRIELRYHGPNHQDGNIFIHLPQQRVLMLVDVIVPGWVPFHALGGATDVAGYLDAHGTALSYAFDTLIAGHLTRTGTPGDVQVQHEYLDHVRRACSQARQSVDPGDIAAATGTRTSGGSLAPTSITWPALRPARCCRAGPIGSVAPLLSRTATAWR
jgi:hypothetical protein